LQWVAANATEKGRLLAIVKESIYPF
jgi:hypothetical protein